MNSSRFNSAQGSAAIGVIVLAIIVLGALLSLNTAAVISVGSTSRALDVARQNVSFATRLELATREAAQRVYGVSSVPSAGGLEAEVRTILAAVEFGSAKLKGVVVEAAPKSPAFFPNLTEAPAALVPRSAELALFSTPGFNRLCGRRNAGSVTESGTTALRYLFETPAPAGVYQREVRVELRLVAVPLTRHGVMPYELPGFIGARDGTFAWPRHIDAADVGPLGLARSRDPADVGTINGLQQGSMENRPGHYRQRAALSEAYQYVFSDSYLQRVADYVGRTHFVQIGAGGSNPTLDGGVETGNEYAIDIGRFGRGVFGADEKSSRAGIIYATGAGGRCVLTDTAGGSEAILLLLAGPGGASPSGSLEVEIGSDIARPVVIVGYNIDLVAAAPRTINGALLLDHGSRVRAGMGPITLGHLSYSASGRVEVDTFRLQAMPDAAEALAPRVVYAVTRRPPL